MWADRGRRAQGCPARLLPEADGSSAPAIATSALRVRDAATFSSVHAPAMSATAAVSNARCLAVRSRSARARRSPVRQAALDTSSSARSNASSGPRSATMRSWAGSRVSARPRAGALPNMPSRKPQARRSPTRALANDSSAPPSATASARQASRPARARSPEAGSGQILSFCRKGRSDTARRLYYKD